MKSAWTRRDFVRLSAGALAAGAAANTILLKPPELSAQAPPPNGRKIRFVSIGTGIRGCDLLRSARKVPTGECVGTADLYDMHRKAGQEAYGADIPTTRDYRSLLDRKDVDAVIVAVADFQHRRVVLDCLAAGKDVYCEKPMSHNVHDGLAMVEAVQKGKRIFQAGSQRVSNIVVQKGRGNLQVRPPGRGHVYRGPHRSQFSHPAHGFIRLRRMPARRPSTGRPGCAMRLSALSSRSGSSAGGALPTTARVWQAICLCTCSRESNASRGINAIPSRAYSTGSLTHFKDGRDYPDLLATLYDYPGVDREYALQSEQRHGRINHLLRDGGHDDHQRQHAHRGSAGYAARSRKAIRSTDGRRKPRRNI